MNKRINKVGQAGFTLIELIVVIVILGILAATALPKFTGLSGDARKASLQAARGALSASSSMLHGRWLVDPVKTEFPVEGGPNVTLANGYPKATTQFANAAGLADDYTPTVVGTTLRIAPKNIPATMTTCYITYNEAGVGGAPTITTPEGYSCD